MIIPKVKCSHCGHIQPDIPCEGKALHGETYEYEDDCERCGTSLSSGIPWPPLEGAPEWIEWNNQKEDERAKREHREAIKNGPLKDDPAYPLFCNRCAQWLKPEEIGLRPEDPWNYSRLECMHCYFPLDLDALQYFDDEECLACDGAGFIISTEPGEGKYPLQWTGTYTYNEYPNKEYVRAYTEGYWALCSCRFKVQARKREATARHEDWLKKRLAQDSATIQASQFH